MKRIFLLLIIIFLCCGCSVTYNLDINKKGFVENFVVSTEIAQNEIYDEMSLPDFLDNVYNDKHSKYCTMANDVEFNSDELSASSLYSKKIDLNNGFKNLSFDGNFTLDNFKYSNAVRTGYDYFSIQTEDNYVLLRTSNKCKYFEQYPLLENIKINIKTDLEVISTNADYVNGNTYTWNIDKNNYTNKSIRLTYSKKSYEEEKQESIESATNINNDSNEEPKPKQKENNWNLLIFIACFGVLLVVIFITLKLKNKRFS